MNRDEARSRFEQIRSAGESAAGTLRALLCELEQETAPAAEPSWRIQAAEVLVGLLRQRGVGAMPEGATPESRELLDGALLGGPGALAKLGSDLAARLEESGKPRAELMLLYARRRCQELRARCLDHLDAIFHAERSQP